MSPGKVCSAVPLLVAACAVSAAVAIWRLSSPFPRAPAGAAPPLSADQEIQAIIQASRRNPLPPPPAVPRQKPLKDAWVFRGKVLDLYSLSPVQGAELRFTRAPMGREGMRTFSQADGSYRIELPPLREGGYFALASHRDCDRTRFFEGRAGEWAATSWEERVRLSRTDQVHRSREGRKGQATEADFALVRQGAGLSDEEAARVREVR